MSNDKTITELISKSLRRTLDQAESAAVEQHLGENDESRKFAELSKLIQDSVAGMPADRTVSSSADETANPDSGLSQDARERLKASVDSAIEEKLSLSQAGLLRQTPDLTTAHESGNLADERVRIGDSREVNSEFNLIRKLGKGGLGNVWLARDEKLNRNVAIKELNATALESPQAWQRFQREAEITGHLEHPNVVPLYQYGVDRKTGEPFYAMRFVGKRTLANAIEEYHDRVAIGESCSLTVYRLLSVFLDICQAIAYAHSRGVVHRDLKPENVALDNFGQVIVLDWGLAKVIDDSELATRMTCSTSLAELSLSQTMAGDAVGTPLYMSPEQAAGELDKIDHTTDVYGLGAILFSILTGKAPHEKSALNSASNVDAILKAIADAETPQPIDYYSCIPKELAAICTRAMARKQHLRFSSVQKLADAVEGWVAGQRGKQSAYESLRMEGRELRADMQSRVRDLERNVRFASGLPPVDALITADTPEDVSVWRERLSTIFQGLLKANPDYRSIAYCRVDGSQDEQQFSEIVRVERHGSDGMGMRVVPKSRLLTRQFNDFVSKVAGKLPEEVYTSLVCDPMCDPGNDCQDTVGLLSAVPVFDNQTEELFGFVIINCNIEQMLRTQMNRRTTAAEIVVACDIFHIMMHTRAGHVVDSSLTKKITEEAPAFMPALEHLRTNTEFIDATDSDIYGARLWLIPNKHGLTYLLKRKS